MFFWVERKATILGHVQRGKNPTVKDRVIGTRFGVEAVKLLKEGITDKNHIMNYILDDIALTIGDNMFKIGENKKNTLISKVNKALDEIGCKRVIQEEEVYLGHHASFSDQEFEAIKKSGYHSYSYEKRMVMEDNEYSSLFLMNKNLEEERLVNLSNTLFSDKEYGNIIRIKGFFKKNEDWFLMNMTKDSKDIDSISAGQDVIIIIGKSLDEEKIKELIEK